MWRQRGSSTRFCAASCLLSWCPAAFVHMYACPSRVAWLLYTYTLGGTQKHLPKTLRIWHSCHFAHFPFQLSRKRFFLVREGLQSVREGSRMQKGQKEGLCGSRTHLARIRISRTNRYTKKPAINRRRNHCSSRIFDVC